MALAVLLLAWELYTRLVLGAIVGGEQLLPAPSHILAALFTNTVNLAPHTWHHYRVTSRDAAGNLAVSGDFTFKTKAR